MMTKVDLYFKQKRTGGYGRRVLAGISDNDYLKGYIEDQ
jgi:hypothetical protein